MDVTSLVAGVFGGFLGTLIVNYVTKNLDYKYDYKKYILKKRQAAYDEVKTIMMDLESDETDESYNSIPAIFYTINNLWEFQNKIATTIVKYKVWLSDPILDNLYEIQKLNGEVYQDFENSKIHHSSIELHRQSLYRIFFNDIRELDDITHFKKNKVT